MSVPGICVGRYPGFFFLSLVFLSMPLLATADEPAAAGVLWETTSRMTMEGMAFNAPEQKHRKCMPAQWNAPPGGGEERGCTDSDYNRDGNTVTWTSQCAGPPEMAGQGEIVFDDDTAQSYTGKIVYATDQGTVVIRISGRATGACDDPR